LNEKPGSCDWFEKSPDHLGRVPNMPLNIVEPNLEKVKPELHGFYVKDAKSGKYHLDLSDLKTHVEAYPFAVGRLALISTLEIAV
jgi:hypothetical protein